MSHDLRSGGLESIGKILLSRVQGLGEGGFEAMTFGFTVYGLSLILGFRVQGLGFRV